MRRRKRYIVGRTTSLYWESLYCSCCGNIDVLLFEVFFWCVLYCLDAIVFRGLIICVKYYVFFLETDCALLYPCMCWGKVFFLSLSLSLSLSSLTYVQVMKKWNWAHMKVVMTLLRHVPECVCVCVCVCIYVYVYVCMMCVAIKAG